MPKISQLYIKLYITLRLSGPTYRCHKNLICVKPTGLANLTPLTEGRSNMASLIQRGKTYYIQDRFGGRIKRQSLYTDCKQIAKEKLREYESAKLRGRSISNWGNRLRDIW